MAVSGLQGLDRQNLREQALVSLRRAITTGNITPGSRLVEADLSEQLGISRGTLREAMRQLQQEGLIVSGARGRLTVRHLDAVEIVDIFTVRGALEALAAAILSRQEERSEVVSELRDHVAEMGRVERGGDLDERIESDLEFHRALCRLSDNATLLHQWEALEGSIRMSIMFAGVDRAFRNMSAERHGEIVDAIESGDPARAAATTREHMAAAAENLVRDDA